MSKRVFHQQDTIHRTLALWAGAFILSTFFVGAVLVARPIVTIEHTHNTIQGQFEYVDVSFNPNGSTEQFAGFDLLIAYDAAALTFASATQGSLLTSCGWEYFTYTSGPGSCPGSCPSGMVRIIALGDDSQVSGQPLCNLGAGGSGVLATLKFLVTTSIGYECTWVPVRFYWADCGDNAFSSPGGDTLFLADSVFEVQYPDLYLPTPADLGTYAGAPAICLAGPIGGNAPERGVNFAHGAVDIVCPPDPIARGDLNLNGLPYEVADGVLFANFFLFGINALDPNPLLRQEQIAASDANADGLTLEFRDFTYLLRVMAGDAVPFPRPNGAKVESAVFTQNTTGRYVSVQSSAQLAGAFMIFDGEIVPSFFTGAPGNFVKSFEHVDGKTRVLLSSWEPPATNMLTWFTYTGAGTLDSVETADYENSLVSVQINYDSTSPPCGDLNGDNRINIGDAVALIGYIFMIWPGPFDPFAADVNCSGNISVSDAVYLVHYIFAGGAAPCASCP